MSWLAIVAALEALEAGDQKLVAEIVLGALEGYATKLLFSCSRSAASRSQSLDGSSSSTRNPGGAALHRGLDALCRGRAIDAEELRGRLKLAANARVKLDDHDLQPNRPIPVPLSHEPGGSRSRKLLRLRWGTAC